MNSATITWSRYIKPGPPESLDWKSGASVFPLLWERSGSSSSSVGGAPSTLVGLQVLQHWWGSSSASAGGTPALVGLQLRQRWWSSSAGGAPALPGNS